MQVPPLSPPFLLPRGMLDVGRGWLSPLDIAATSPQHPAEPQPRRPPTALTSSFLSSDSRAFRSSSFRMIALSSAILSWKRRASFSSNCCS